MKINFLRIAPVVAALLFSVAGGSAVAQTAQPSTAAMPAMQSTPSAAAAKTMPSDAAIADAKSKGMVWVNLNTKVYHKDDAVYGKTKNGQFMTEADAQKMGARMAKTSPVGKKKTAGN